MGVKKCHLAKPLFFCLQSAIRAHSAFSLPDLSLMAEGQPSVRAVEYARNGDSSVLQLTTRPWPARKKGQVVVQNMATSVNPVDAKVQAGRARPRQRGRRCGASSGPRLPVLTEPSPPRLD